MAMAPVAGRYCRFLAVDIMFFRNPFSGLFLSSLLALPFLPANAGNVGASCTLKDKPLYGRVQIVNAFPDFRVQVVNAFPDLRVQTVNAFADSCGRWQYVNSFPDFKIQFVNAFPDLRIQYVDAFPGI